MGKEKFGTLQIRINLTKAAIDRVKFDGPVTVYDQAAPGLEHSECLTKNPMAHRINGGQEDVLRQIKNAIDAASKKYTLEI